MSTVAPRSVLVISETRSPVIITSVGVPELIVSATEESPETAPE